MMYESWPRLALLKVVSFWLKCKNKVVAAAADRVPSRFVIFSDDAADINDTSAANEGKFHPQRAAPIVIDTTVDDNLLAWAASSAGGEVLFHAPGHHVPRG